MFPLAHDSQPISLVFFYLQYYNESHVKFRAAIRQFVDTEITPFCHEWDEAKQLPKSLFKRAAEIGWLGGCVGAPWPKEAGTNIISGLKPEQYDVFHELIGRFACINDLDCTAQLVMVD